MRYEEHIMGVTKEEFHKGANILQEVTIDKNNVEHDTWIVAELVCAMQFFNDRGYSPGDEVWEVELLTRMQNKNDF